jgi:cytochrome c
MAWDKRGNLYITVGNNTGGGMTDERPGNENADDQRTGANTNDLRGKILRIHPEPDGTYTIPPDNLFPPGMPRTRPEIYAMGMRNPWRVSVDSRTGFVYWGEVGPSDGRSSGGPTPYDEYNQARGPGFFGFPYFVGENEGVAVRDFLKSEFRPARDPARPFNDSLNNTGLRDLPPAQPAFIAYSYETSAKYPELGSGAHSAVGGPIYHRSDFKPDAKRPFPPYYEGKWLIAEFERGLIMSVTMDEDSRYVSMEQFLPRYRPLQPIDITFGPEGDLYVLDYGSVWFAKSPDSSLVKIEYNAGNRKPAVVAAANTRGGAVPLQVSLSSQGTSDPDGDRLQYEWRVSSTAGTVRTYSGPNPRISLTQSGAYTATLTATDPAGASDSASVAIVAGNTPPDITLTASGLNETFVRPGQPVTYAVKVTDREDAAVARDRVAVSINHLPEDVDLSGLAHETNAVDATTRYGVAKTLLARTDCSGCHARDTASIGPTYVMLAAKYQPDPTTLGVLANKVKAGSSKVWGEAEMPPHPNLTTGEIRTILEYFLNVGNSAISTLPLEGSHTPELPDGRGRVVVRAVYTDMPVGSLPAQTSVAMKVLRGPMLNPASADVFENVTFGARSSGAGAETRGLAITAQQNGYIGFRQIDLTGIRELTLTVSTSGDMWAKGGIIEVRTGGPNGQLIGAATVAVAPRPARGRGAGAAPAPPPPAPTITLRPSTGFHDMYFVFRNDQATPAEPLMTVSAIVVN